MHTGVKAKFQSRALYNLLSRLTEYLECFSIHSPLQTRMFKRVEKRQRKKAEEEELGLNEEMKEVLGMHDTDSDESDSDSESESSPTIASEQDVDESKTGSKRKRGDEGDHSEEEEDEGEHTDDEDESEAADEQGLEEAPMSVQEALNEPIFIKSMQPDVKACVVCPGRLLKNARMVDIHRASGVRGYCYSLTILMILIFHSRDTSVASKGFSDLHNRPTRRTIPENCWRRRRHYSRKNKLNQNGPRSGYVSFHSILTAWHVIIYATFSECRKPKLMPSS